MNYLAKGFTLVEILLVMAALGILTTIWIVTFDPLDNIGQTVEVRAQADMANIEKALQQYLFDNEVYPVEITTDPQHICNTGTETEFNSPTNCTGLADLRPMVPSVIDSIPLYPEQPEFSQGTGYAVQRNSAGRVEVVLWEE